VVVSGVWGGGQPIVAGNGVWGGGQPIVAVFWGKGRWAKRLTPTTHEILERLREKGKILLKIKNHHAGVERNPITGSKEKFLLINFLRYLWKS